MKNFYTKKFDEKYSQSREAQFIEYLNQRGAQVPKLISNCPTENTLKMEYVGNSLEKEFANQNTNTKLETIKILYKAIETGYKISKLDVWHFDLALRNFTVLKSKNQSNKHSVYLIDFGAAISNGFHLQKPLWLRPEKNIHHKDLIRALENDWYKFFKQNSLDVPAIINNEFSIPINKYNDYWSSSFRVQDLNNPICIISHSFGIMVLDFINNYPEMINNMPKKNIGMIKKTAKSLINLNSAEVAHSGIMELLADFDLLVSELEFYSSITPRPKLQGLKQEKSKTISNKSNGHHNAIPPRVSIRYKFRNFFFAYFMLAAGFFFADRVYLEYDIFLTNYAYYVSLFAIILLPSCLVLITFSRRVKKISTFFLRVEAFLLFFYFIELSFFQVHWLLLSCILFSGLLTLLLTIEFKINR